MEIYLDHNATTPIDAEVRDYMLPYLDKYFGNPSSMHEQGTQAKKAIENARKQVAGLINCSPQEIIFTSGGTESNNYAIKGIAFAKQNKGNHIITSQIEHPAVLEVCKYLEKKNFQVTYLPVDEYGSVHPGELEKAIRKDTILITIMHSNNEIGTIQPIDKLSGIAQKHKITFHTDAAQSCGKIHIDVQQTGVDLLSIAGHKLYVPKGIGALYIKDGTELEKMMHGADHERNMRPGTENVLEIAGLGKACEIARRDMKSNQQNMKQTRDLLYEKLKEEIPEIHLNGHPEKRLPNTLSVSFPGIEANLILNALTDKGIAASAGAACHTDEVDISLVLSAIGLAKHKAMGTIRFSTGKHTTEEEIDQAASIISEAVSSFKPSAQVKTDRNNESTVKLTHYTQGMGCACKLKPQELEQILRNIPHNTDDPNILVDTKKSDDSAVYRINNDLAIVQTVDFFTPIVDDAYAFGQIAAANALSDIYAMGATPLFALNIVGFPTLRLPMKTLENILKGADNKAKEAGISILGGHSVEDHEPKFGMVITGKIHPDKILTNGGAKENDLIVMTKPIGTGILSTAMKRNLLSEQAIRKLIAIMSELNKTPADIIHNYPVTACTDVTGFGLLGHLNEMTASSEMDAEIHFSNVPVIKETHDFVAGGLVPGGTKNNLSFMQEKIQWDGAFSISEKYILNDAQTSGGLLFTIPERFGKNIISDFINAGINEAKIIGRITKKGNGKITIKKE
jgi:cysteine desulfurase NifS/selenium donor protein